MLLQNYKTVVVIPHFHKERRQNLCLIVSQINRGSLKPDMIMIFNNNPEYIVEIPGAVCINSQVNLGSSIRYAMAYATGAKYVIGHDDDLCLGKDDVQNLYTALLDHPESVIGFCGADMGTDNPYLDRKSYVAKSKQEVDVVLGRVNAMGRKCLSRYFDYVKNMGLSQFGNHEDIPLSLANKKAGFKNYIIPLDTCELPTGGVGLEFQEDHFTHRNELAKL